MRFLNIFFPFRKHRSFLTEKRWHRCSVVLFGVCVVLCFLFNCFLISKIMPERPSFNVNIKYNLRDFTKSSSSEIVNTVVPFVYGSRVGCLMDNKIKPLPSYVMEKTVCNADIPGKIGSVARDFLQRNPLIVASNESEVAASMKKIIDKDTETRYCFVNKNANCASDKIVAYNRNAIFYLEVILASFFLTYIFALLVHIVYFNGLIFILYGENIEKS